MEELEELCWIEEFDTILWKPLWNGLITLFEENSDSVGVAMLRGVYAEILKKIKLQFGSSKTLKSSERLAVL